MHLLGSAGPESFWHLHTIQGLVLLYQERLSWYNLSQLWMCAWNCAFDRSKKAKNSERVSLQYKIYLNNWKTGILKPSIVSTIHMWNICTKICYLFRSNVLHDYTGVNNKTKLSILYLLYRFHKYLQSFNMHCHRHEQNNFTYFFLFLLRIHLVAEINQFILNLEKVFPCCSWMDLSLQLQFCVMCPASHFRSRWIYVHGHPSLLCCPHHPSSFPLLLGLPRVSPVPALLHVLDVFPFANS